MQDKVKLLNCEMYKQGENYYLDLEYEIEKTDGIYIRKIPKVSLGLPKQFLNIEVIPIIESLGLANASWCVEHKLLLNNGARLPLIEVNGELYRDTLVKKKVKKMTVAEIEKELGYSVEIVSK